MAETIFTIANLLALGAWLLLAIMPRWRFTSKIVISGAVSLLLAAAYLVLIALYFGSADGGFGSLAAVMRLFTNPWVTLAGWLHYLAFDLFVGSWEVRDSQLRGVPHLLVIPCLVLTFLLGPIGFLLYNILRVFFKKELQH